MSSPLFESSMAIGKNAYKSILFRISSILLQITIYKIFSYIAYRKKAFTSYLMLAESLVQKLLYIASRGPRHGAVFILVFMTLLWSAALYDSMLWGLDFPGYLFQTTSLPASAIRDHLRPKPSYIVSSDGLPGEISSLDLKRDFGDGLWDPTVNVSLTGLVTRGNVSTTSTTNHTGDYLNRPTPRIWLDDDGFSVGVDYAVQVFTPGGCIPYKETLEITAWDCRFERADPSSLIPLILQEYAMPNVWWDAGRDDPHYETVAAYRANPWCSLATGGGTILMKTVITVTKGTARHAFLISAFKASLAWNSGETFEIGEIQDLVGRVLSGGRADTSNIMDQITSAIASGLDIAAGEQTKIHDHKINSRFFQFLSIKDSLENDSVSRLFRVIEVNITLIRSETLQAPPVPFEECDTWFKNEAAGGRIRGSDCSIARRNSNRKSRFLGEIDSTAVFLLRGIFSPYTGSTSASSLNDAAWRWIGSNTDYIENLLLSRAYILGVSQDLVTIEVHHTTPAISAFQLLLILLPSVLAMVSWIVVLIGVSGHFQGTLFSNLVATTHVDPAADCNRPRLMRGPPEVSLVKRGEHILLGTQSGVFWHGQSEIANDELEITKTTDSVHGPLSHRVDKTHTMSNVYEAHSV